MPIAFSGCQLLFSDLNHLSRLFLVLDQSHGGSCGDQSKANPAAIQIESELPASLVRTSVEIALRSVIAWQRLS